MKAVPSSYHLLLQYTTLTGTAEIQENQTMFRTISGIARKKSGVTKTASSNDFPVRKKQKWLLINNNHRAIKAKTQAPLMSRKIQTSQRRKLSNFVRIPCILNELFGLGRGFPPTRKS